MGDFAPLVRLSAPGRPDEDPIRRLRRPNHRVYLARIRGEKRSVPVVDGLDALIDPNMSSRVVGRHGIHDERALRDRRQQAEIILDVSQDLYHDERVEFRKPRSNVWIAQVSDMELQLRHVASRLLDAGRREIDPPVRRDPVVGEEAGEAARSAAEIGNAAMRDGDESHCHLIEIEPWALLQRQEEVVHVLVVELGGHLLSHAHPFFGRRPAMRRIAACHGTGGGGTSEEPTRLVGRRHHRCGVLNAPHLRLVVLFVATCNDVAMMPVDVVVAEATVEDAGEILCLQRAAYQSEALRYDTPRLPPLTQKLDELREDFQAGLVLKATMGGRIVGSVRATVEGRTAFIGRLIVAPDLQRRGIASRLMEEIETALAPAVDRFELFTGDRSEENLALYERLGYSAFDRREVGDGVELVFMEKRHAGA